MLVIDGVRVDGAHGRSRIVVVVDDDAAVRDSTALLLEQAGHTVYTFSTGEELIALGIPTGTEVILLDVMMPGLSGLETLRIINKEPVRPAVVVLTGHGDIPLAVEAMKLGAAEFLEKPFPMQDLLDLVAELGASPSFASADPLRDEALEKVQRLSPRQREVLKGIALGEPSKVTAHRLNLSVRTVEAYRGHLFSRLQVRGMADAVRIAVLAGIIPR